MGELVSHTAAGNVASHYPVMLEDGPADEISIVSHVGRPDEVAHGLGSGEVLVIIQGPHGYVSPSWYPDGDLVPTWNHVTAHLWGTPEILSPEENYAVLEALVDQFEQRVPRPRSLRMDEELTRRIARGTVGLRLRVARFEARAKLSQNKPADVVARITDELEADGPYANAALAGEMRRLHGG